LRVLPNMEASESPSVTMKKIRINELARELEVKPGAILDLLPELGVAEKKTHSSSVDEDVAVLLRKRLIGSDVERYVHPPVARKSTKITLLKRSKRPAKAHQR